MSGLYMLIPTLIVIFVSFLVVRAAAIALMMTGMEENRARFQALSAFTGTGFTTRDAEIVVNNPRRRRIITWLMILGNAGIVTVIVSATSTIVSSEGFWLPIAIAIIILWIFIVYRIVSRRGLTKRWEEFVQNRLYRRHIFQETNVEDLFLIENDYGLVRIIATSDSLLLNSSAIEEKVNNRHFMIMGINRGKRWISLPEDYKGIREGDRVILYGRLNAIHRIFKEELIADTVAQNR
jgi:hypothetical protein